MDADRIERVSPRHRATADYMRAAGRRSLVHGLVEVDVTAARRHMSNTTTATGERPSLTAYVAYCLSRALEDFPGVNAYTDWRGRTYEFADVDVNVMIETTVDGERLGVPHVLRRADCRSFESLHEELRAAQESSDPTALSGPARLGLRLPGPSRRLIWRLPRWFPQLWKRFAGTAAVTSVGMAGDTGGWAISPTNYTVQATVGGLDCKPRFLDGELSERELLPLTVTLDHDVVDGAEGARFVDRLVTLLEDAHGLGD